MSLVTSECNVSLFGIQNLMRYYIYCYKALLDEK